MLRKKIVMLGLWGVGKTSLVQRYVHSIYEEKYHSTIGVKTDSKDVSLGDEHLKLMIWDIAGAEADFAVPLHYVQGAEGCLLVIDGTRPESLDCALDMMEDIQENLGPLPCVVVVVNKSDLDWKLRDTDLTTRLEPLGCQIFKCSAKTGENVEEAFLALAQALAESSASTID